VIGDTHAPDTAYRTPLRRHGNHPRHCHYQAERNREEREVTEKPEAEAAEVADVLTTYGMTTDETTPVVDAIRKRSAALVDFIMRFELGLEKPDPKRALRSAERIAGAYIAGGEVE
jgi:FtsZ-interacting cell division protein YlmF